MQLIKYFHRGYRCIWNGALCTALLIAFACFSTISAAKNITLNLKDADISAVISTVSEATGKNFIVDPRVKGKVTIISSHPMASEELYSVFLSILEVHGFSAVPSGNVIKILPDASAKQKAMPIADDESPGAGDQIVTRVIALRNVSSSQLVPILRPLVPQQGHLAAYVPANILIISDRAANIARLMNIIGRIDTPSNDEIEIIQLEHASADEVVRIMTSLEQKGKGKGKGIGASAGGGGAPILIADERTNSILVGGGKSGRLRIKAIISHLDTPLDKGGNTRVVYLRYAQAEDMVKVLTGVSKSVERQGKGKGAAAANKAKVDIQADEATNALVITAPPDIFRSLESVIKQLDIRRAQVLIETVIAEVSENLSNELGVQWIFDGTPAGDQPVGVVNFGAGAGGSIAEIGAAVAAGLPPAIGNGATIGLGRFNSSTLNFAAVLRVLKGDGTTNILSTPTLVTMDNEEAEIVIGQTVPFITGSFTSPGGGGATPTNPFQTIKREDVGITLKVKPQINEGDAVKLEIEQTIDSISSSATGAVDLITNTRSIKTNVIVDDGQMIVLGGLINDEVRESVQKVPLLGDIPLLGWLFSHKTSSKVKQNLMMFLQPTIIRDAALASRLTHGKYSYQRARQLEVREKGLLMLPGDASPVMPTMQEALALPPAFDMSEVSGEEKTSPVPQDNSRAVVE
ncbi:General secretion pathway protein D [hydrothermal vent metagenome]|uniref:General secretion pathway protein D n=1 Tax=hydrothermal vent metagenome TaxID=652676 RepID=A0A3B0Z2X0_9ZZZZ